MDLVETGTTKYIEVLPKYNHLSPAHRIKNVEIQSKISESSATLKSQNFTKAEMHNSTILKNSS